MDRIAPRLRWLLRLVSFGLFCGLALYTIFHIYKMPPNPRYGGGQLSYYLRQAYGTKARPFPRRQLKPEEIKAREAIALLGRDCLPLIQAWLEEDQWKIPTRLVKLAAKCGWDISSLNADKRAMACRAAVDLSDYTSGLAPELLNLSTNQSRGNMREAMLALQSIRLKPPNYRTNVFQGLSQTRANASAKAGGGWVQTEQDLLKCLFSWEPLYTLLIAEGSELGAVGTVFNLSEGKLYPNRVIPLLISSLSSTNPAIVENRAIGLGNYGPLAIDALPILLTLTNHPKRYVRHAVSNALVSISLQDTNRANNNIPVPF